MDDIKKKKQILVDSFNHLHCVWPHQAEYACSLKPLLWYKSSLGLCVLVCVRACVPITVSIKRNNSGGVGRRNVSHWSCAVMNGVISCCNPCQDTHALHAQIHAQHVSTHLSTHEHRGAY